MTHFDSFAARHFIDNEFVPAQGAARDVVNPSTLAPCGRIAEATADEIDRALTAAEAARPAWSRRDAKSRAQLLHNVANSIEQSDKHDIARLMPAPFNTRAIFRMASVSTSSPTPGVVNLLAGGAAVGKLLVNSPRTHIVAFTGSVAAARSVASTCASQLKPSLIEAGGNDPLVVSDKAPLDVAIAGSITAAFHLAGQICTSAERFLVHEKIHDTFVTGLVAGTRALRIGDGPGRHEIGPLVSEAARSKVIRLVDDAVSRGAKIATGGRIPPHLPIGWFYEPTILTDVTPDMPIFREELFGPVAPICRVQSFDEALALANRSEFGLGANLFTTDLREAMRAADELEAGMVWVNNPLIDNDALPFGGWKQSGLGRSLSRLGLDVFRQSKMIVIDPQPHRHDWWYPYPDCVFFDAREAAQKTSPPNSKDKKGAR